MKIQIAESNRFGRLTLAKLTAFERSLGTKLPEAYRKHLLEHNGGYVDGSRRLMILHHIHGIHDGPDWARFPDGSKNYYGGLVPEHLLPIADDPGGNLICIVLIGPDRGAVCFWNHERADNPVESITQLAPDFDAFLRGLAIRVAIARKRIGVIKEAMADIGINTPVYAGKTVLDLAFERGSLRMIRLLVHAGAKIRPDALIEAVRNNAPNTIRFLLAHGVDVNYAIPDTGFTALMLSASRDGVDVARLLLTHGANRSPKNHWGKTAADLANSRSMKQLLRR